MNREQADAFLRTTGIIDIATRMTEGDVFTHEGHVYSLDGSAWYESNLALGIIYDLNKATRDGNAQLVAIIGRKLRKALLKMAIVEAAKYLAKTQLVVRNQDIEEVLKHV